MEFDLVAKSSGKDELDGKLFSIENNSFIFELLRNKMYQDPILAICREITCNARDANRAAGKPNEPIYVKCPTNSSSKTFEVTDFGFGISPDIIENVFIKYAASTKRSDNQQTGGFGLGAKTPFAYSDSFNIITVYDGIRYQYLCYIDESKVGKISLIDSHKTSDCSGTTIVIPVKSQDYNLFMSKLRQSVEFWDVLPKSNISLNKITIDVLNTFDDVFIAEKSNSYYGPTISAIIDGIKYPIDSSKIGFNKRYSFDTYFKFGNGVLSITPNRESIHYDEKTISVLRQRIGSLELQMKNKFQEEIDKSVCLSDAISQKKRHCNFMGYSESFKFKGYDVPSESSYYLGYNVKAVSFDFYNTKTGIRKSKVDCSCYIDYSDTLYLNDSNFSLDDILNNKAKIAKKLSNNSSIIFISEEEAKKNLPFDALDIRNISSIITSLNKKNSTKKIIYYKLNKETGSFSRITHSELNSDTNPKVLCQLLNNKSIKSDYWVTSGHLSMFNDINFYGIIEPSEDDLDNHGEDFIFMEDYIKFKLIENESRIIDYNNNKSLSLANKQLLSHFIISKDFASSIKIFLKTKCEYLDNYFNMVDSHDYNSELENLTNLYYKFGYAIQVPDSKINIEQVNCMNQDFLSKYPLLKWIDLNNSYYRKIDDISLDIARYIDEQNIKINSGLDCK